MKDSLREQVQSTIKGKGWEEVLRFVFDIGFVHPIRHRITCRPDC